MRYLCEATVDVRVRIDEELELWLVCFNEEAEVEGEEERVLFVPKDAKQHLHIDVELEVEAESEEEAKEKAMEVLGDVDKWGADFFDEGYEMDAAVAVTDVKVNDLRVREATEREA